MPTPTSPPLLLRVALAGLALLLLTVAAPGAASAQTADDVLRFSTRLPGTGARALALGGAGTGGIADFSAMYSNPAGLGLYTTSEMSVGLPLLLSRNESTFRVADGPRFGDESERSEVRLGNVNGVYRVPTDRGSLVFALGYNRVADFNRTLLYQGENAQNSITQVFLPSLPQGEEWDVRNGAPVLNPLIPFAAFRGGAIEYFNSDFEAGRYPFESAVFPGTRIRQEGTVRREGAMNEVNFASAVEIAPGVLAGASANVSFGRYVFENELVEIDAFGENANYEVDANLDGVSDRFGLASVTFRERFESDLTGFNLRAGISAQATEQLRFGFTFESPTWYSVDEEFDQIEVVTAFQQGSALAYGDQSDEDEARGRFTYEIQTPLRLGAGIAFETDALLLLADVEFVDWTDLELTSDTDDFFDVNDVIEREYSYVFNWRGGVEYRLDEGLALRGGIAYRPDPRSFELTLADGERDDRARYFFSAGLGYSVNEQFVIDVGWMQERATDQFSAYGTPDASLEGTVLPDPGDPNSSYNPTPPVIDEDVIRNHFSVGLRYRF